MKWSIFKKTTAAKLAVISQICSLKKNSRFVFLSSQMSVFSFSLLEGLCCSGYPYKILQMCSAYQVSCQAS